MLQFTQLTNGKGRAEAEKVKIYIFLGLFISWFVSGTRQ